MNPHYSKTNSTTVNNGVSSSSNNTFKKIHCNYTVNLRIAPVTNGIYCRNSSGNIHQFNGLNAFNSYFQYLRPQGGFSLPDVWDGYFHITLGKFFFKFDGDLRRKERSLVEYIEHYSSPKQHYTTVFPCEFRTEELNIHSGDKRFGEAEGVDFVTLKVNDLSNALDRLRPFLGIIKNGVINAGGQWEYKSIDEYRNQLHVTLRKYEENHSNWSSNFMQNCGVLNSVKENPLEFVCIALDIAQTRRQARQRDPQRWWIGVTGDPSQCTNCGKYFPNDYPGCCRNCGCNGGGNMCSGCGQRENNKWSGCCYRCGNYERLRPLWSTEP